MSKKTYAWVSVAGSDPEPAAITIEDGKRVASTTGCPDPFYIDEPKCPCVFLSQLELSKVKKLPKRPLPTKDHQWRGP